MRVLLCDLLRGMKKTMPRPGKNGLLPVLLWLAASAATQSAPITFNTALPVAKSEFVFRQQFIVNQSGHDPGTAGRDRTAWSAMSVLGYGITGKLALFGVLPYVNKSLGITVDGKRIERQGDGLGDISLFARYTALQKDGPGRTLRIAPFAGFKAATGRHDSSDDLGRLPASVQPGSGSWDAFGGIVTTYQTLDYEIDAQLGYRGNGSAQGFSAGNQLRLDASLQYRLWPGTLTGAVPGFLYCVLESSLLLQEKNHVNDRVDVNSGGIRWFLTPGLQYVTRRWVLETALQIPVVQDLNGTALENAYLVRAGFRYNF